MWWMWISEYKWGNDEYSYMLGSSVTFVLAFLLHIYLENNISHIHIDANQVYHKNGHAVGQCYQYKDFFYYSIVRPITVKPLWVWESSILVYKILVWQGEVEDYIGS